LDVFENFLGGLNYGAVRIRQNSSSFGPKEAAMSHILPAWSADVSSRPSSLKALREVIAIWDERQRFRRDLAQKSKANPHLIDDIGLTKRQVEAEIAKPFWQA
jgi:uncharacterized protein YjiS (DUF1127 family)